ncbi:MAG: hypothetical protein V8S82_08055 [Eubacteriales bacterium]
MKDMNEFRRAVYEKAGKKTAEEKVRKLRLKKFVTFAACFAVVIAPMLVALGTASKNKNENILFGRTVRFLLTERRRPIRRLTITPEAQPIIHRGRPELRRKEKHPQNIRRQDRISRQKAQPKRWRQL